MGYSFSPIKSVRSWFTGVLPLVYDEALSYYEQIAKFTDKLNEVISTTNELGESLASIVGGGKDYYINVTNPGGSFKALVGDGNTDNTEAFQALANIENAVLFFPAGVYATKSVACKCDIVGAGALDTQILCLNDNSTKAGIIMAGNSNIYHIGINGNKGGQSEQKACLSLNDGGMAFGVRCYNGIIGSTIDGDNCEFMGQVERCTTTVKLTGNRNLVILTEDTNGVVNLGHNSNIITNYRFQILPDTFSVITNTVNIGSNKSVTVKGDTVGITATNGATVKGDTVDITATERASVNSETLDITCNAKVAVVAPNVSLDGENISISSPSHLKYETPEKYNDYFDSIKFKAPDNSLYDVLVASDKTEQIGNSKTPILCLAEFHDQTTGYAKFYTTTDCVNFNPLESLTNVYGRDGCLAYKSGTFYMAITYYSEDYTTWATVIYTTKDFKTWDEHRVKLSFSTVGRTGSPDIHFEGDKLVMYVVHERTVNSNNWDCFYTECTNLETLTFNTPVKVAGLPNSIIDPNVITFKGTKYMLYKNEDNKTNYIGALTSNTNVANIKEIPNTNKLEGATAVIMGDYMYVMFDRYLDPNVNQYGTQNPVVTRTLDTENWDWLTECNVNNVKIKESERRHGTILKLTPDAENIVLTSFENNAPANSDYVYHKINIEHLNAEDLGTTSGTTTTVNELVAYPHTLYCVFNNPNGASSATNSVVIKTISNPYCMDDFYLYIETYNGKTITVPTRNFTKTITVDDNNNHACLHFVRGVDNLFTLVS